MKWWNKLETLSGVDVNGFSQLSVELSLHWTVGIFSPSRRHDPASCGSINRSGGEEYRAGESTDTTCYYIISKISNNDLKSVLRRVPKYNLWIKVHSLHDPPTQALIDYNMLTGNLQKFSFYSQPQDKYNSMNLFRAFKTIRLWKIFWNGESLVILVTDDIKSYLFWIFCVIS